MSDAQEQTQWYAIRSTFEHDLERGRRVFEQRIFLYLAPGVETALKLAESESAIYLQDNDSFVQVPGYEVFELGHNSPDMSGREVWSFVSFDEPK